MKIFQTLDVIQTSKMLPTNICNLTNKRIIKEGKKAVIVADLLPNLFAATGRAHLGAAAPTLDSVVTIFNGLKQPQLRDPMSSCTRNDARTKQSPAG